MVLWRRQRIQSVALFSKAATAFCFPLSRVRSSCSTASPACGGVCVLDVLYIHTHTHTYVCVCGAQSCPTLLRPHELQPARFLCPWDFPGKNTRVGCHFLLQEIPSQGSNPGLLHWQADSLSLSHLGSPIHTYIYINMHIYAYA